MSYFVHLHHNVMLSSRQMCEVAEKINATVPRGATIVACGMLSCGMLSLLVAMYDRKVVYVRKEHDQPRCGRNGNVLVGHGDYDDPWYFVDDCLSSGKTADYVSGQMQSRPIAILVWSESTDSPPFHHDTPIIPIFPTAELLTGW